MTMNPWLMLFEDAYLQTSKKDREDQGLILAILLFHQVGWQGILWQGSLSLAM